MIKLRALDSSYFPYFRDLLRDQAFTVGKRIAELIDLSRGSLRVWFPEEIETIDPNDFPKDIFWAGSYKMKEMKADVPKFVAAVFPTDGSGLLLGETDRSPEDVRPRSNFAGYAWLVVPSAVPAYDKFLCVCKLDGAVDDQSWTAFTRELKYHSVVSITRRPADVVLRSGELIELEEGRLAELLRNTSHILVGVFDEMSMVVWERHPSL